MDAAQLLHREQIIPRPIEEVFAFFEKADNLEAITPPWLNFRIVTPAPIVMAPGALIDYRLSLRGVPVAWRTRIVDYDPPHRFIDEQIKGPYALWRHTHTFIAADVDETRMIDDVRYRIGYGPFGAVAHTLFVERDVNAIFDYRARIIAERFPARVRANRRVMAL